MEKVIFHIDVNSAYLSWEAVYRLKQGGTVDLREIPCAVGGDKSKRQGIIGKIPGGKGFRGTDRRASYRSFKEM